MPSRLCPRFLAAGLVTGLATLVAGVCSAAQIVKAPHRLGALVERWTPGKGPPARFTAAVYEAFDCGGHAALAHTDTTYSGMLVILGEEADGTLWSAQSQWADAVDYGCSLSLVKITPQGRVVETPVVTFDDWNAEAARRGWDQRRLVTVAVHQKALRELWRRWPTAPLTPLPRVRHTTYEPSSMDERAYPGWMIQGHSVLGHVFEFELVQREANCWKFPEWRAWARRNVP